ncbi:MAG: glycosyltransferase family 39 protein, partial [Cyanobacteria bacterium P01_H01_bin.15]
MTTPPSAHLKSRRSRDDVGLELGICGVLLVGAALLFFYNLDGVPLRDWDEGTVARVAQEIAEAPISANRWLSPTLWGDPYWNKPPLVHNLIAWAFRWGGVSTLMARLPSASLATLSVLALYRLGRELFRRRFPAVIAALVYLTSLPIARNGRLAMLDLPSICFALLAWVALLRSRRNWHWSLGVGLGLSAVGLTKGAFLALLMGALMGGFLVWDTPRLLRTGGWLLGLLLGGLPLIAWYGWQSVQYPQVFLSTNLDAQAWQRLFTPVEG